MPYINKLKRKKEIKTDKEKKRRKIYSSTLWQKMRMAYLQDHPLSEISQWEGKSNLSEHIHHIVSFLDVDEEQMLRYAYDSNNFIAVTQEEHCRLHNGDLRGCKSKEEIKARVMKLMEDNKSL